MGRKRQKSVKAKVWLVVIVLIAVTVLIVINQIRSGVPFGMREVKSFNAYGVCASTTDPACGNCPDSVINDKCYVKYGSFDQYK